MGRAARTTKGGRMKRLTFDGNFCDIAMCQETPGSSFCEDGYCTQRKVWDRLKQYEDMEEQGLLLRLPCKVGDTLWVTGRDNVPREMELEAPDIRTVCTDEDNLCMSTCNRRPDGFCAYRLRNDGADIGKTVFLTREEAEKELEGNKESYL